MCVCVCLCVCGARIPVSLFDDVRGRLDRTRERQDRLVRNLELLAQRRVGLAKAVRV